MRSMYNMSRQPTETGSCDSTTGTTTRSYPFESVSMASSHSPIEHSIKEERDCDSTSTFLISNGKALTGDFSSRTSEKGPDTTFNPDITRTPMMPPPYDDGVQVLDFGQNHAHNYGPALPVAAAPHRIASSTLTPVMNESVTILGYQTLYQLGLRLDPELLPAQNWKMMAEYMDFSNLEIRKFETLKSPTMAVIDAWGRMGPRTIGDLINILTNQMERVDVVTDIPQFILKDVARHRNSMRKALSQDPQSFVGAGMASPVYPMPTWSHAMSMPHAGYMSTESFSPSTFLNTFHDSYEEKPCALNSSRPVQVGDIQPSEERFDAFVLCNVADKEFVVNRFLPKVEDEAKLKLCFADRDVPPGKFVFTEAMNYMFRRSRKLVVILSDDFFQSQEHEWQSNLAISQDPASRRQTIIPVKYKKLTNRNIFDYLGCCDLTKTMKEEWFWDKIIKGIKA